MGIRCVILNSKAGASSLRVPKGQPKPFLLVRKSYTYIYIYIFYMCVKLPRQMLGFVLVALKPLGAANQVQPRNPQPLHFRNRTPAKPPNHSRTAWWKKIRTSAVRCCLVASRQKEKTTLLFFGGGATERHTHMPYEPGVHVKTSGALLEQSERFAQPVLSQTFAGRTPPACGRNEKNASDLSSASPAQGPTFSG